MRPGAHLILAASLLIAQACDFDNAGETPPEGTVYFPNGLDLLGGPDGGPERFLLVTNSNFDLRYNSGTLQAYDLGALADAVEICKMADTGRDCSLDPTATLADVLASTVAECEAGDGDCEIELPEDLSEQDAERKLLADEVLIGSFSNGFAVAPGRDRAFVASRTEPSLTVVDVDPSSDDDVFMCGDARDCTTRAARGRDPETGKARGEWVGDPMAVLSGQLRDWLPNSDIRGDYALVAHAGGSVSLFMERLEDGEPTGEFELASELRGLSLAGLPLQFTGMARDPATNLVHLSFVPVVSVSQGKAVMRIGVSIPEKPDGSPDLVRASLFSLGSVVLDGVSTRTDTRDIAFIEHGSPEPENRALLLTREPNALVLADLDETRNQPFVGRVTRTAALGAGPSRLVTGELQSDAGPLRIAVITCFNARELYIVDLETMLIRSVIPNFSGPFDLALDASRALLFVADFRSSVIRIVDLSPLTDPTAGEGARVVATLGSPRVIQELQ